MFPDLGNTYIPSDVSSPSRGTHIPSNMCFPTRETHIPSDMCFPTSETYIASVMSSPTGPAGKHMLATFCYSPATENLFDNPDLAVRCL